MPMREASHRKRSVMLVLHDVAPETWPDYQPFVEAVDQLGDVPMTWLVVPDFHHRNALKHSPAFCRLLERRLAQGDELALHGYYHADDGPLPRGPRDFFMRRVYTHEGEFYGLDQDQALQRLQAGLEVFHTHGWPVAGFVAPAWLMSEGTRQALRQLPLRYTSTPQHLYRLPEFTAIDAPGLVWSARSAWRRGLSKVLSDWQIRRWQQADTLRLGLHPVDMRHPSARNYWLKTLQSLLAEGREPLTKSAWLDRQVAS
ncbi:polysaccharide deacetylase family protein [Pseudomonas farsensis]|uniref:Polysaccharide deacetylase family protein n=2 Tax=Pseudomonas farsensis TaxID=2745492 RepID=A0ABU8QP47_9PSED